MDLHAVLFDVDFTLARPGPELSPEGYRRLGERYGLVLEPSLYPEARARALAALQRHPELAHDDEIWVAFTEHIIRGMGGNGDGAATHAAAREMTRAWEIHANFELYEDALPVLDELRRYGLKLGLVSNTGRDLREFIAHHGLDVDAAIASRDHGKTKPDPSIFIEILRRLEVAPEGAAMIGDSLDDDVEGARALGIRAFLLDRDGMHPEWGEARLPDLFALPAALGLPRPG